MSAAYLTAAGSILTVESRHSSYIRASLKESPFPSPFDVPLTFDEVYTLAAPFIVPGSCPSSNPTLPVKVSTIIPPEILRRAGGNIITNAICVPLPGLPQSRLPSHQRQHYHRLQNHPPDPWKRRHRRGRQVADLRRLHHRHRPRLRSVSHTPLPPTKNSTIIYIYIVFAIVNSTCTDYQSPARPPSMEASPLPSRRPRTVRRPFRARRMWC